MTIQAVADNTPSSLPPPSALGCLIIIARQHGLHLTSTQLIQDNLLTDQEVTLDQLVRSAEKANMRAKLVSLDWDGLSHLKKALPAIVRLRDGSHMVLLRVDGDANSTRIVLRDPNAAEDALLVIDRPRFEVTVNGQPVRLTKKEFDLLWYLVKNRSRVVTRDAILARLWDYGADVETRTVDVHIRSLRRKLGDDLVRTVHGVGYAIEAQ